MRAVDISLKGIGKTQALHLAAKAAKDEGFFLDLLQKISSADGSTAMRASWVLASTPGIDGRFAKKYSTLIFDLMAHTSVGGVQRELMKVLMQVSLPEDISGKFIDLCFQLLMRPRSEVAVKYHAIKVIERSLKSYPELKNEFLEILDAQLETFTDAGKRYVAKLIHKLRK